MFIVLLLFLCFGLVWPAPFSGPRDASYGQLLNHEHRNLDNFGHFVQPSVEIRTADEELSSLFDSKLHIREPAANPASSLYDPQYTEGGYYVLDPITKSVVIHYDA